MMTKTEILTNAAILTAMLAGIAGMHVLAARSRTAAATDNSPSEIPTPVERGGAPGPPVPAAVHNTHRLMVVTAYCPCSRCCGQWADGFTASGAPVEANGGRFCAAPRSLPFGALVVVPGYAGGRPVPVLDRGGAIQGDRLDVFFATHAEALEWGRRELTVTIIKEN